MTTASTTYYTQNVWTICNSLTGHRPQVVKSESDCPLDCFDRTNETEAREAFARTPVKYDALDLCLAGRVIMTRHAA